jgi:hypothetical protein
LGGRTVAGQGLETVDSTISAGRDGSVWVFSAERFLRLGDEAEHAWDGASFIRSVAPSVAPDGTVWLLDDDVLRVFDGRRWKVAFQGASGFHMWPDGTTWTRDPRGHLLRGDGTSWTDVHAELEIPGPTFPEVLSQLWVSPRIDRLLLADQGGAVAQVAYEVLHTHGQDGDPDGVSVAFIGADVGGHAGSVDAGVRHVDMADAGDWWIYQTLDCPAGRVGEQPTDPPLPGPCGRHPAACVGGCRRRPRDRPLPWLWSSHRHRHSRRDAPEPWVP